VAQDIPDRLLYMGSVAMTYQLQFDNADREMVFQQNVVNEVDDQRLFILAGNIGVRVYEKTAVMLLGEYGVDLSYYEGTFKEASDTYTRLSVKLTHTISSQWQLHGGMGRLFNHDVEVTEIHVSTSIRF